MKKYILPVLALIVLLTVYLVDSEKTYCKTTGEAQGTTYSLVYEASKNTDLSDTVKKILDNFDLSLSSYIPNSVISRINNNDSNVITDKLFNDVFIKSKEIYELTNGAFDITVAPLVNAWGFGWKTNLLPDRNKIDSILAFVGMNKVTLVDNKIIKKDPRVQLDVNAIAQGYSADVLGEYLEKLKIKNYLVEVGGEVRCKGKNPDKAYWKIGIEKPTENNDMYNRPLQTVVRLENKSLATSGNYRKFYEKDGVKFVHTINPATGQTIKSNLLSASVITSDCQTADALATSFMVLGLEKSKELVNKLNGIDAYFIYSDKNGAFKTWSTPGFKKFVEKMD